MVNNIPEDDFDLVGEMAPAWESRGFRLISEQADGLRQFAANPRQRIPTGIAPLDGLIEGVAAGEVYYLIAASGVGKSMFATNIMFNQPDIDIMFFSLEMPEHQVLERLWTHVSGLPSPEVQRMVKTNSLPDSIKGQMQRWGRHVIVDRPALSLPQMSSYIGAYAEWFGKRPDVVIIDYLELIGGAKAAAEGWQRTEGNAGALKDWAKSTDIGVYVLHQLNRTVEAWEPPTQNSARGSGFTEADVVIGLYNPSSNPKLEPVEREMIKDERRLTVIKNRPFGRLTHGQPIKVYLDKALRMKAL